MRYEYLYLLSALIGLSSLFVVQALLPIHILDSSQDLSSLQDNQKVEIRATVIDQYGSTEVTTLKTDINLTLSCSSCDLPQLKGKKITTIAQVDTFYQPPRLNILTIEIQNEKST